MMKKIAGSVLIHQDNAVDQVYPSLSLSGQRGIAHALLIHNLFLLTAYNGEPHSLLDLEFRSLSDVKNPLHGMWQFFCPGMTRYFSLKSVYEKITRIRTEIKVSSTDDLQLRTSFIARWGVPIAAVSMKIAVMSGEVRDGHITFEEL